MVLDKKSLQFINLTCDESINASLQPIFEKLGVTYFLYILSYNDNDKRVWLTNNPYWTEHFYKKDLFYEGDFEKQDQQYVPGYYLWETLTGQKVYDHAREFNIDHGMTIVNRFDTHLEFTHLASTRSNREIKQVYLNNVDIINQMILFLRDSGGGKLNSLMKIAMQHPLILNSGASKPAEPVVDRQMTVCSPDFALTKKFLSSRYNNVYFTRREIETLSYLKNGLNAKLIADELSLSKRTVESYFEHIKIKLGCSTLFQLGYKLAEIERYRI